jgi:hypothetical protein
LEKLGLVNYLSRRDTIVIEKIPVDMVIKSFVFKYMVMLHLLDR